MRQQKTKIPGGWKELGMIDICEILSGSTPKTDHPHYWGGKIFWATPLDLSRLNSKYIDNTERKITQLGFESCSVQKIAANSLIMSSRAPIGYLAINKQEITTNQGCKSFVLKEKDNILFLYYYLSFKINYIKRLGSGSTFAEVGKKQLENIKILLPPLPEQNKIAEILGVVDEEIEKTEKIIERAEKLMQGLSQSVFGDKKNKIKKIGDFCKVKGGKRLPKGELLLEQPTAHPYIRIVDFEHGSINLKHIKYLSDEIFGHIRRYTISKDDIYISIAGTIGMVGIIPDSLDGANLTENAAKIVLKKELANIKYIYYFLSSTLGQKQIKDLTVQTSQPKLALNKIEAINIPLPTAQEQSKIVKILSAVDDKILIYKKIRDNLAQLKKGLMGDLLSGRVRVC